VPHTTEAVVESARAADLLINATLVGMWPRVDGSIWPNGVPISAHLTMFDLVYNPLETSLLRQARSQRTRHRRVGNVGGARGVGL
jgi:shikimate 5-dehydrogenase